MGGEGWQRRPTSGGGAMQVSDMRAVTLLKQKNAQHPLLSTQPATKNQFKMMIYRCVTLSCLAHATQYADVNSIKHEAHQQRPGDFGLCARTQRSV